MKRSKKSVIPEEMFEVISPSYAAGGKLKNKVAIITGGDSGIGRSVAVMFAKEGANVAIVYNSSDDDAKETKRMVEEEGREAILIKGDLAKQAFSKKILKEVNSKLGIPHILINNAGTHEEDFSLKDISKAQLVNTFEVNIFSIFYLTQEALNYMKKGAAIINTASVVAYRGSDHLIDYAATKGAIISFTRSLSKNLAKKGIRVNAVAPGPVWTPLVVSSFSKDHLKNFGKQTPMERAGKPSEIAPAYVFLASDDASYITGQVIHVNGGEIVGG